MQQLEQDSDVDMVQEDAVSRPQHNMDDEEINPKMFEESTMFYAKQMSIQEYEKEKLEYSRQAVEALINSSQYQKRFNSCGTCWSNWLDDQCRSDCMECAGYTLTRPCPICRGKCGKLWKRDIELSHSRHEAHWDGTCGLPEDVQHMYLRQLMTEADEETILDGLNELSTT